MAGMTVDQLVALHADELLAYLCRFVGDRSTAEDLLGDVFVKLLQQQATPQTTVMEWRPWLYRVAMHHAISYLRKRRWRTWLRLDHDAADDAPSVGAQLEASHMDRRVQQAIVSLSPTLRSTLLLSVYQELSYKEIADVEQINLGTVRSRLNEARRLVKLALEAHDD